MGVVYYNGVLRAGAPASGLTDAEQIAYEYTETDNEFGGKDIIMTQTLKAKIRALEEAISSGGDLSNIISRLERVENTLGIDTLIGIELALNQDVLNVTTEADGLNVAVYAKYSKSGLLLITQSPALTCNTTNQNVAYWDPTLKVIVIAGLGTATLTFGYQNYTTTCYVSVANAGDEPVSDTLYYIGYGTTFTNVLGVQECKVASLNKTWYYLDIPLHSLFSSGQSRLMICVPTTKTFKISLLNGTIPLNLSYRLSLFGGLTYNIYYTSPLTETATDSNYTIEVI